MKKRKGLSVIKKIDDELYYYQAYKKEYENLQQEILHGTPNFDNNGGGKSSVPSDPTSQKAVSLVDHNRLRYLNDLIFSVETVYKKLPEQHKELMTFRYWSGKNPGWTLIAHEMKVDRSTAIRWRDKICREIGKLRGMI